MGTIHQLPIDRINAIPPLGNALTPAWPRILETMAKRGQQRDPAFGQIFA
jgi:hypothetical protein